MTFLYIIIDYIFVRYIKKRKNNKSIVLIRIDAIGDFVIWLDSAKEYRNLYPDRKIVLIANSTWAKWASDLPYWDEVWHLNLKNFRRNPIYRIKMLRLMRNAHFEIAIQPTYSRTIHGDSLVRASCASHRIGSVGDISNIERKVSTISNKWYTLLVPSSKHQLMEIDRNAEFIKNLSGGQFIAAVSQLPIIAVNTKSRIYSGKYIVLFPGASWTGKRWPLDKFCELSNSLYDRYGILFILCGGSDDVELCAKLGIEMKAPFINLAGKTSLNDLAGLLSHSQLLISNDTSAVHIAAAVGAPSICILGGGHYGRFLPYSEDLQGVKPFVVVEKMPCFNCNWKCSQLHDSKGPMPCIAKISVEKVIGIANEILNTR